MRQERQMDIKGRVMEIQHFSVNDGDGIRSTIFLAGCPLRCQWCANPEGFTPDNKIAWYKKTCVACGKCAEVCPMGIGIDLDLEREKCTACGKCADVCPTGSRKRMVTEMTADAVMQELEPNMSVFQQSGGGVTFSGGDPMQQAYFVRELSSRLYDLGIGLAVETEGYFDFDEVEDILEKMDLIFVDIKVLDPKRHRQFTGRDNDLILTNIKKMRRFTKKRIVVRIPVIEGVNADDFNIRRTAEFVKRHLPNASMELLPYHRLGEAKYEALGMDTPSEEFKTPPKERIEELKKLVIGAGVQTISFK